MTYPGPQPAVLTRGAAMRVVDLGEVELDGVANAAGVATIPTAYLPSGQYWRVERIVVSPAATNTQTQLGTVTVYRGDNPIAQRARDWTPLPPGDAAIAEYPSYLTVYPSECLTVQIVGAGAGDRFHLAIQYQLTLKIVGQWAT